MKYLVQRGVLVIAMMKRNGNRNKIRASTKTWRMGPGIFTRIFNSHIHHLS